MVKTSVKIVIQVFFTGFAFFSVAPEAASNCFKDVFLFEMNWENVWVFSIAPCSTLMNAQDILPVMAQIDINSLLVFLIHKIDNCYWFDW